MFRKQEDSMARAPVPKWKYVVTILMLLIAGAILGIYSSIERQLEKSFHQMWLEEEIPYPVESEYTMLTATSMVGYGLYAIGLDQSSLLYQPLHYLNRIAYESAMKKIPEDDSIREWFYYYRYYAVPIVEKDLLVNNIGDVLGVISNLHKMSTKSNRFRKEGRYKIIFKIFNALTSYKKFLNDGDLFNELDSLLQRSKQLFCKDNPFDIIEGTEDKYENTVYLLPFKLSLIYFHFLIFKDSKLYESCDKSSYVRFLRAYKDIFESIQNNKDNNFSNNTQLHVNNALESKKRVRNALAESAWVVCHINLDAMEEAYDKNRRRYQY